MRKLIIIIASLAALAVPTAAMANAPDGDYKGTLKNGPATPDFIQNDHASLVGEYSARSIQNGQFISGHLGPVDQTTYPGSRADIVHDALGH
jgi:hypothetical protein